MATITADITHADGSVDQISALSIEEEYAFEKMDIASLYVDRPQVNGITLHEDRDEVEVYVDGSLTFGGVLRDVLRGGASVELVLDSYERLGADGERSEGGLRYEAVDDTLVYSDAIADVEDVTAGTVENVGGNLTFVFSYASPAKRIRTVAEAVNAEVMWNPDKTIDIVSSLGSDKSATTLSPSQQNISGEFNPERGGGDKHTTHLIMLGAGEGVNQVQATLVPDNDPRDYEGEDRFDNVVRYTPDAWVDGDRTAWDSRVNKDIADPGTLADHGKVLIEELNREYLDVELTVEDQTVELGDEFTISHPRENVDQVLRATDVTRLVDKEGVRYETTFSNRRLSRQTETDKIVKDSDRFNLAFEGTNVTMTTGGGRQPIHADTPYEFWVYYPDEIQYEHRVNLRFVGLPYRSYTEGVYQDNVTDDGVITPQPGVIEDFEPLTYATIDGEPVPLDGGYYYPESVIAYVDGEPASAMSHRFWDSQNTDTSWEVNQDTGTTSWNTNNSTLSLSVTSNAASTNDVLELQTVDTFDLEAVNRGELVAEVDMGPSYDASSNDPPFLLVYVDDSDPPKNWFDISEPGTFTIEPAVTSDAPPPSRVYVQAVTGDEDGAWIEADISKLHYYEAEIWDGNGRWTRQVDLRGDLTPGETNRIELVSGGIGHLQANLDIDVYRQILGNG